MGGLTTKQRFAFIFSLYVFSFFVILYFIFFLVFNLLTSYQIRNEISIESKEIISNNLLFDKNIVFIKDQVGASLKEYLILHNTAAIFLDSNKNILRTYGVFALGNLQDSNKILQSINLLSGNKQIAETNTSWQNQELATSVIALRSNKVIIGYIILGKSLEEFSQFKNIMTLIFVSLGALSLVGSFFVGYFISRRAFSPLNQMIKVIEEIELNKLDSSIPSKGNPNDEIVRLSEQFNKMLIRLKDMAERQQAFIANASHELRTPLTRAISSFDLLSLNGDESKSDAKTIRKNLFQIDTILEKLLLLTKLKKDIKVGEPYALNTNDMFNTLRDIFANELMRKNIVFHKNNVSEIKVTIPYEYILIVLKNLISNAIRYTETQKNLFLIVLEKQEGTTITIQDEGKGMTKDEIEHMFDRFYRGKGSNREEGYGIGLSLVKQICDLYGIKIQVTSEIGSGTSISLILPSVS